MHILSPVALPKTAEGEKNVSGRTGYRTSDLWLLSQTLSLMVYTKFRYSLNILFSEPTKICEYKRKLNMYRVPEFRTMLTSWVSEAQRRPHILSSNPTGVGICHTANGAQMRAEFRYCFNNMHIRSDIS